MAADKTTITIDVIRAPEEGWYRAHIPEIPVYGDGDTVDEALSDLKNSLAGYVEVFGLQDALFRVQS